MNTKDFSPIQLTLLLAMIRRSRNEALRVGLDNWYAMAAELEQKIVDEFNTLSPKEIDETIEIFDKNFR